MKIRWLVMGVMCGLAITLVIGFAVVRPGRHQLLS